MNKNVTFSFGHAIEMCKHGYRIREGTKLWGLLKIFWTFVPDIIVGKMIPHCECAQYGIRNSF